MPESGRHEAIRRSLPYVALGLGGAISVWLASYVPNADWFGTYDPAVRGVFDGSSPYAQPLFVNPPWAILLLSPFVLFPPNLARGLVLVSSLVALIYAAWRLQAPKAALIALLLSPTAIASLLAANLDAFVFLGVFLPPTWGLFLLMLKPQIGLGAAAYDFAETWRKHRLIGVARVFAPIVIATIVSGILFPLWIERMIHKPANVWNRSLFPYGIPVGMILLWVAFRARNVMFAMASTPFFAPYLTFPSYLVVQVALLHEDVEKLVPRVWLQAVLCVLLWIIMLAFRL